MVTKTNRGARASPSSLPWFAQAGLAAVYPTPEAEFPLQDRTPPPYIWLGCMSGSEFKM